MKKLSFLLAMLMLSVLVLTACAPDTSSLSTSSGVEEAAFFDSSKLHIKALDEKTLEVKLNAVTPYFLELAAFPTFSPVHQGTLDEYGEEWATKAETYISNGAYTMVEWVNGSHMVFEKNKNYWNVDALGPEKITFKFIEGESTQLASYNAGELDFIDAVPADEIPNLEGQADFFNVEQLGTYYMSFNVEAAPFDNPLVRKAFTLAIDRQRVIDAVKNGAAPAGAFVPGSLSDAEPGSSFRDETEFYYDPTDAAYAANLEEAKAALTEAGYPGGEGFPTVSYMYNNLESHATIGAAMQAMWAELGVDVQLEAQEWGTFVESRNNGDFQIARNGWIGDYNDPISFLDMWVSGSGNNVAQYKSEEYDAIIDGVKNAKSQEERMTLMHKAEDLIFEDWMLAPIYFYTDQYMLIEELQDSVWALPIGFKYFMFADKEELNVTLASQSNTYDPALTSTVDGGVTVVHAFEALLVLDKNGLPTTVNGGAAESYTVSEDGLTYTFTLRDGMKWSNGDAVTAQDFVNGWVRAINPNTGADYSYLFECIVGYKQATDENAPPIGQEDPAISGSSSAS